MLLKGADFEVALGVEHAVEHEGRVAVGALDRGYRTGRSCRRTGWNSRAKSSKFEHVLKERVAEVGYAIGTAPRDATRMVRILHGDTDDRTRIELQAYTALMFPTE